MKIVLFGAGGFLQNCRERIEKLPNTEVVKIIDNNNRLIGSDVMGIEVSSVNDLQEPYDYIVITSNYAVEIEKQLLEIGIDENKIKRFVEYESFINRDNKEVFTTGECRNQNRKSVVAITPILEFNGAFIALVNLLEYLSKELNFKTTIAAPRKRDNVVDYLLGKGIEVIVDSYIEYENTPVIETCDYYIVNTLLMRKCLKYLDLGKTIWWLHETAISYEIENGIWGDFQDEVYTNARTYCVSAKERAVFEKYFPKNKAGIFEYGISDEAVDGEQVQPEANEKIVFAIIGFIANIKGQDILINAVNKLSKDYIDKFELWIIGDNDDKNYMAELSQSVHTDNVKFFGGVSHEEMKKLYKDIDVVVSSSRQDSLPIVVTEALTNSKICIISDAIGTVNYLKDGIDAFVFESENVADLADKMMYVIDNYNQAREIGRQGRNVFEKHFTINKAGERFLSIIEEMGS